MLSFFDINNTLVTLWGYNLCWLEAIGFVTGFVSIYLAGRNNVLTFVIGLLNCAVFFSYFFQQHLYSMMLLQIIFAIINVYGIVRWSKPVGTHKQPLKITRLEPQALLGVVLLLIFGSLAWFGIVDFLASCFPEHFTEQAYPFVDAVLFVSNVVGQWLLARKKIENWWIWLLTDTTALVLWIVMGLYLTAILYLLYLLITVNALREWNKTIEEEK